MTPEQLIDTAGRHQVLLEGLKAGMANDFTATLQEINDLLAATLGALKVDKLGDISRGNLNTLLGQLTELQAEVFDKAIDGFMEQMPELAKQSTEFETRSVRSVMKPQERTHMQLPPAGLAHKEALKRPVQATGEPLEDMIGNWSKRAIARTNNAVRIGYDQGQTVPQIIKRLIGTEQMRHRDGVSAVTKREAQTVVRTAVQHVAATAREVTWEENNDLVLGVEWVATLDGKTTPQCRALDGKRFKLKEGPRPPIHPNCRSTTAPDLSSEFDFLDEGATRSSQDGYVDANETYYTWLKKQSPEFQDEVLGPTRATLFRDGGLSADEFSRLQLDKNFKPITLNEMKEKAPLAFQRAGLMHPELDLFAPNMAPAGAEKWTPNEVMSKSSVTGEVIDRSKLAGRPKPEGATGKVWQIADDLEIKHGRTPTRQEVLAEGLKQGINESTVGVQFGKWRKAIGEARLGTFEVKETTSQVTKVIESLKAAETTVKPPVPEPRPPPPKAENPPAKEGEAKWKAIKAKIDEALSLGPNVLNPVLADDDNEYNRRLLAESQKALSILAKRAPDGKGGINVFNLTVQERREYEYRMKNFRAFAQTEFNVSKHGVSVTRTTPDAVHNLISAVIEPKKTVRLDFGANIEEDDKNNARKAVSFFDKVVADKYKDNSIDIQYNDDKKYPGYGGYYNRAFNAVHVKAKSPDLGTMIHEMGHHFEYEAQEKDISKASKAALAGTSIKTAVEKALAFLEKRRGKEKWEKFGGEGFQIYRKFEDEWASRGGRSYTASVHHKVIEKKMSPYASEVVSTGVERLFQDPVDFYRRDPEHFEHTVRTLADLW